MSDSDLLVMAFAILKSNHVECSHAKLQAVLRSVDFDLEILALDPSNGYEAIRISPWIRLGRTMLPKSTNTGYIDFITLFQGMLSNIVIMVFLFFVRPYEPS